MRFFVVVVVVVVVVLLLLFFVIFLIYFLVEVDVHRLYNCFWIMWIGCGID